MSETKFTPGPWRLRHGSESKIENIAGRKVATADLQDMQPYSPWGQMRGRIAATPERKANAALIAAAPEMYYVLQHYFDLLEQANNGDAVAECKLFEDIVLIEQVLMKARGEA